jgi:hypothetical protein
MFIRIMAMTALVAMLLVCDTTVCEAGRFTRMRVLRSRSQYVPKQTTKSQVATYPRVRQIDGRSLWDLGKQNGQWPQIRF